MDWEIGDLVRFLDSKSYHSSVHHQTPCYVNAGDLGLIIGEIPDTSEHDEYHVCEVLLGTEILYVDPHDLAKNF